MAGCATPRTGADIQVPPTQTVPVTGPTSTPDGPKTAPSPSVGTLHANGPWLIFTTIHYDESGGTNGLWAVNPDGSGLKQLISDANLAAPQNLEAAVSPSGGHIAYIQARAGWLRNLALHLLSLPAGEDKIITPLTNKDTEPEPDNSDPNSPSTHAVNAIVAEGSLAWSPDGQNIFFVQRNTKLKEDLQLYRMRRADGKPILIHQDVTASLESATWLIP